MRKIWWRPRPFYKKSKLSIISELTVWTFIQFVFIVCPSWELPKYIEYIYINRPKFITWLPLFFQISGNVVCCKCFFFPVWDVINFEICLNFLIEPFSYKTKKVRTNMQVSQERREHLRWNKKHYLSFLKNFYWSK